MTSNSSVVRSSQIERETKETSIQLALHLDGEQKIELQTGLGFFDHMLHALAFHAGWDLSLQVTGDLHVDDHHTIEDCGLALGQALTQALGGRQGIQRFGYAYAPLDESLARCVIDLSGRPASVVNLELRREQIGDVACENLSHFFQSWATTAGLTLHLDVLRGENDHHRAEAAFKATALAIRMATQRTLSTGIPSTKGTLSND